MSVENKGKKITMIIADPEYFVGKVKKVCAPKYKSDVETFDKAGYGDIRVSISKDRNPGHHNKIWPILNLAVDHDIIEKIGREPFYCEQEKLISPITIKMYQIKYKKDSEVLRKICMWLFVPLVEEIHPDGKVQNHISSMDFSSMDQLVYQDLYNDVINYISFKTNIPVREIEQNKNNYR